MLASCLGLASCFWLLACLLAFLLACRYFRPLSALKKRNYPLQRDLGLAPARLGGFSDFLGGGLPGSFVGREPKREKPRKKARGQLTGKIPARC